MHTSGCVDRKNMDDKCQSSSRREIWGGNVSLVADENTSLWEYVSARKASPLPALPGDARIADVPRSQHKS